MIKPLRYITTHWNKLPIKKCPICNCDTLWIKELRFPFQRSSVNVIFKCDRCAYVNIHLPNEMEIPLDYLTVTVSFLSYETFFDNPCTVVDLKGNVLSDVPYRFIGRDFWNIPDIKPAIPLKCPVCGEKLKIYNVNPFIRGTFCNVTQYRVDIICKCKNDHISPFGVHISKNEFEQLIGGSQSWCTEES